MALLRSQESSTASSKGWSGGFNVARLHVFAGNCDEFEELEQTDRACLHTKDLSDAARENRPNACKTRKHTPRKRGERIKCAIRGVTRD
jgi:hypothetical protein